MSTPIDENGGAEAVSEDAPRANLQEEVDGNLNQEMDTVEAVEARDNGLKSSYNGGNGYTSNGTREEGKEDDADEECDLNKQNNVATIDKTNEESNSHSEVDKGESSKDGDIGDQEGFENSEEYESGEEGGEEDDEEEDEEEEDDEEDEEEEDDDVDDDDDDEPPMLKYTRIDQLPKTFFTKEPVSSVLIHEACFAFGTSSGLLHVTDQNFQTIGTIRARRSPILSIHTDGTHVIAASIDGTVLMAALNDLHSTLAFDLKTAVYSVVFNKNYKDTKSFIYGTKSGKVVMSTTNWLGTRAERVIAEDSGPIVKLEMIKSILLWISDDGLTFYDTRTDRIITRLKKTNTDTPAELCWPRVSFPENGLVLVGWYRHVWLIKCDDGSTLESNFKLSSAMSSFSRPVVEPHVAVESEVDIDEGIITGIGSLKGDLVVLTVNDLKVSEPPELRIINSVTLEETSTDEVILKGYKQLIANDLFLGEFAGAKTQFFIVCASDGIVAEQLDLQGRFDWYLQRSRYLSAWEMSEHLISKEMRCNIGIKQVENYLEDDNWQQAAEFLSEVLECCDPGSFVMEKWEQWSWIFIHSKKIQFLASILPKSGSKILPKSIYNECLKYFLDNDEDLFLHYTIEWEPTIYDYVDIEQDVEQILEISPDSPVIRRALANVYIRTDEPIKAVPHLIHLQSPHTIELLEKHHLLSKFVNEIPEIIKFTIGEDEFQNAPLEVIGEDLTPIIDLLVQQRHEISPDRLISLLKSNKLQIVTFFYLKNIAVVDAIMSEVYETELMELYAELVPNQLLAFLKKAQHYDIDLALSICSKKELYPGLVFLLGKVGQTSKAMYLIIDKLDDPDMAIEFATTHKHQKLWDIFLEQGISKPRFIKAILQNTGTLFDVNILKKIPQHVEIEGLKDSLERIMQDNRLVRVMHEVILSIIEDEGKEKAQVLDDLRWRGKYIELEKWYKDIIVLSNGETKSLDS